MKNSLINGRICFLLFFLRNLTSWCYGVGGDSSDPISKGGGLSQNNNPSRNPNAADEESVRIVEMEPALQLLVGELNIIADNTSYLDCLGYNAYYGTFGGKKLTGYLDVAANNFSTSKWRKSWIVPEFGSCILGWTAIGVMLNGFGNLTLQVNSSINAQSYIESSKIIAAAENNSGCLGGYVLSWQHLRRAHLE